MPDIFTADERREIHEAYFDAMSDPRPYVPDTLSQWHDRAAFLRPALAGVLGLDPLPDRVPLDMRVTGSRECDGYRIDRVHYQTWPGFYATGWLYRPTVIDEPAPAILNPHGHWEDGARNATVQARLIGLARRGYVALAVDSLHVTDFPIGLSSLTVMTWNNIRGIDSLQSLPDVDGARIGCTGASGGGQQTMYAAALDDRITATVNVCLVTNFKKILFSDERTHCVCNHVPGLMALTDEPEMCGLIAPVPSLYLCVTGDWTADFPRDEYPDMQRLYDLHGAADAIDVEQWDCGHDYHAEMRSRMYDWFATHLGGAPDPTGSGERDQDILDVADLNALDAPVEGARPWTEFPAYYREQHAGARGPLTADSVRTLLGRDVRSVSLTSDWYARRAEAVAVLPGATRIPLPHVEHSHAGASCTGLAILLHPDGREGVDGDDISALRAAGWDVLIADVRLYGELGIQWDLNATVWGRPVVGMATDDIRTLLDTRPNPRARVACVGFGDLGWAAICAAATDDRITRAIAPDLKHAHLSDQGSTTLPNVLRYGSPPELVGLCGPDRIAPAPDGWVAALI
ncbi:hypothetical protein HN371_19670 [Candidatus Poribacteria bacterium]|jgi:hypothetical protein|nr:hypothetical protein [Candidatus Poribacteria bacterium]MBT5531780.1 hypothetical protein [Candidatus Poribacteria bacterium]MBT5714689.1 hypothetical protein [Candidatus Poribacteria bacterium]MBT7101719.1 hypothetical protein [Candidatus Poribacteria bacterium]MBT7804510.1 hypothetical protein [Candidatus Poribacteria bacterium]